MVQHIDATYVILTDGLTGDMWQCSECSGGVALSWCTWKVGRNLSTASAENDEDNYTRELGQVYPTI